ncbi:hypothetical protein [Prochlorococcus marinus]|uniref:hypothetical protein n=1 Tax=Prochlorococcus marinus TaxID=1219 RepID=UPI0013894701|nr:hypothetical protein [Prochlorococcus marinus]
MKDTTFSDYSYEPFQQLKHKLMTDPTENEQVNEELSTDELKGVSGGFGLEENHYFTGSKPEGSGYGGTREDWKKSKTIVKSTLGDGDGEHE